MVNKLTRILLLIFCIITTYQIQGQINLSNYESYYYADGEAIEWVTDSTSVNIIIKNMKNYNAIANNLQKIFNETEDEVLFDEEEDDINL